MANGIPTPRPIFWLLVSPLLLAAGETGSSDALGVDAELVRAELDEATIDSDVVEDLRVESLFGELADDLVDVDSVTIEDTVADTLRDADADAEAADECAALLDTEYDTEGSVCEDCESAVELGHCQLLCVGVACASVVGGVGGRAVSGPNSFTK
jgi:hypothetical protein